MAMGKNCGHEHLTEAAAKDLLTEKGLNRTKVKIKILQILSESQKPLSVPEIHGKLDETCDVSTVFRSITQYKEKHLVHEVNLDEGFFRYELVQDKHDHHDHHHHHHHHVRCRVCGDIQSIEHCDLGPFEKAIAKLGFKDMEHRLEFTGVCSKCSKS
ncbi:Fur family transcriptional regulator [Peredibacter starrii]|uniref:Transcriptional repressor n=1 Tax=Peredibacter starrii TaxID=28202 RepID=A0AAX4HVD8_9BACT|nr:transcriptional repressor [Peredibacter starrii]WPU66946.1 transcriptional repressor [Peredibacter starrii]